MHMREGDDVCMHKSRKRCIPSTDRGCLCMGRGNGKRSFCFLKHFTFLFYSRFSQQTDLGFIMHSIYDV